MFRTGFNYYRKMNILNHGFTYDLIILKSNLITGCMSAIKKTILIVVFNAVCITSYGQQVPVNPVSYRIYTPFILNPAAAGSKDFFSTEFLAGFQGKTYSQIVSGNARIGRKIPGYHSSPSTYSYTGVGVGASAFNDVRKDTVTSGAGVTLSYHYPLNSKKLSYISAGATIKGVYHFYNGDTSLNIPFKEFFYPDLDIGIYYYSPTAYAGLSATDILGPPADADTLNTYSIPAARHYNLIAGYKILLSRSLNLVLEPSVIIVTDDSLSFDIKKNIQPALKLYAGSFCLGTYFNDYSKISFFFQYRYPKFYVGTYFALPKDSPFFKKSPTAEIALGINFSRNGSGYTKNGHW